MLWREKCSGITEHQIDFVNEIYIYIYICITKVTPESLFKKQSQREIVSSKLLIRFFADL